MARGPGQDCWKFVSDVPWCNHRRRGRTDGFIQVRNLFHGHWAITPFVFVSNEVFHHRGKTAIPKPGL